MNKFIFVCYDHGCGGEKLSVEISKKPYCEDLQYKKIGSRTFTYDVLNKVLLYPRTTTKWINEIPEVPSSEKYYVVPTHKTPEELENYFTNSVYVVINFPGDTEHLRETIFEKTWMNNLDTLKEKLGFCKRMGWQIDSTKKIASINKSVNIAEIWCIAHDLEYTSDNVKYLFEKEFKEMASNPLRYTDTEQIITVEYNNIDYKKLDRLDEICVLHR